MAASTSDKLQTGAYFFLAGGFILSAASALMKVREQNSLGGLSRGSLPQGAKLRAKDAIIDVKGAAGKPKTANLDVKDIDTRAALIAKLIRQGSLNAEFREAIVSLMSQKCDVLGRVQDNGVGTRWCVPEKDCMAEVRAIFNAVRNPKSKFAIRYIRDNLIADVFTGAERTLLKTHGGDCFVKGTKVLRREGHALVPIESVRVGDEVWGHERWSTVTKVWGDKGVLSTWLIKLNNGSSMRLTPNHKVWIADEADARRGDYESSLRRVYVRDLKPRDVVIQPERIDYGTGTMDAQRAYVEGLYLSDGWSESNRFAISGKDGCPKEAQKREVEDICTQLGLNTRWDTRYISVNDAVWAQRMATMGSHAPQKHALSIDLEQPVADQLLRGIMADSGMNSNGKTKTFTTTSHDLWLQTRVLLKMQGVTCSERYIVEHGGLGSNPIWRLQTRLTDAERTKHDSKGAKLLRVKEIIKDDLALPCWDIETDDHKVWLPEADWTTSQCDDYVVTVGAALLTIGHPVRMRIVAVRKDGVPDKQAPWSHIYLLTPMAFDDPDAKWISMGSIRRLQADKVKTNKNTSWLTVDASMDRELGWEAPGAREVARTGKAAGIIARVRDYNVVRPGDEA